jgi:cation transport protein ChaC
MVAARPHVASRVAQALDSSASGGDGEAVENELWVFGYGSLMWRPGFPYLERQIATVRGYHRSLCIYSHVHRGTRDKPGLVLGLDRGGSCKGIAFRVAAADRAETFAYLRERELVTSVYLERCMPVTIDDTGRRYTALTFVVDQSHIQYAGKLDREAALTFIEQGIGRSGENPDYVRSTHAHLVELGIRDRDLDWFVQHLPTRPTSQRTV